MIRWILDTDHVSTFEPHLTHYRVGEKPPAVAILALWHSSRGTGPGLT